MRKKRKWLRRLIAWLVVIAAVVCLVVFVGIPLYGPQAKSDRGGTVIYHNDGEARMLTMETDELLFELDTATTHFTVTEKATGRSWTDVPVDAANDPVAKPKQKQLLQSNYVVSYRISTGAGDDLDSFTYAIEKGNYAVEQGEDGTIVVHYSVGRIDRIFAIPEAIPEDTYNYYKNQLSTKDQKKLNKYDLYNANKMASLSEEERAAIIEKYPMVAEESLYILRSDATEDAKGTMEKALQSVGYTPEINDEIKEVYFPTRTDRAKCVFNFDVIYKLENNDLVVTIPISTVRYEDAYPISTLTVLPAFGAAGVEDDGFMLVPEGGGAIIDNNNGKAFQNGYKADVYGWDYARIRNEAIQEPRSDFALFGAAKNGGSYLCFIESGASLAKISADVSLKNTASMSYNLISASYTILHNDEYDIGEEKQGTVVTYEKQLPDVDIVHRYRFLDTDDYVEMALAYGDYLRQTGALNADKKVADDLPVAVEIVASVNKKVVKAGLPVDSVVPTTTFSQAQTILTELKDEGGFTNMSAKLSGWANGGLNQSIFKKVHVEGCLGGTKGLDQLISQAKNKGIDLYFDSVHCFAYDSSVLEGFIAYSDAARFVTREQVKLYPYSAASYQPDEEKDVFYLAKPSLAAQTADKLVSFLNGRSAAGVAFRDVGMLLSADYNQKNIVTREQVKALNVETLKKAQSSGLKVLIKEGNDYALGSVDLVTEMNLKGTKYSMLDRTVPFYQIAIHGSVSYTGDPINLASDYVGQLLACAEYGAGLDFTFMYEDTKVLQDTVYSGYYGSSYQAWKQDMLDMSTRYQREMAGLNSLRIVGHEYLTSEVTRTVYEDGTSVLVNYSNSDYAENGYEVPARDYAVVREG